MVCSVVPRATRVAIMARLGYEAEAGRVLAGGTKAWRGRACRWKKPEAHAANAMQPSRCLHHRRLPLLRARQAAAQGARVGHIEEIRIDTNPQER